MPNAQRPAATWEAVASLRPWDKNPRKNDGEPVARVAKSIQRFGFSSPIVARLADRRIIAGHTRWKAAKKLGMETVPVRFLDIDEDQAAALALADNKLSEITPWDDDALADVLREIEAAGVDMDGLGWSTEEIDALIKGVAEDPIEATDDAPEVQLEVHSKPGEVYALGPHRLVCGDSTKADTWALISDGVEAIYIDPPYGIAYSGKGITAGGVKGNDFGQIMGDDDTTAARGAFAVSRSEQDRPEVWWGAHYYADAMPSGRAWLVWDKMVVGDVYSAAELAWTSGTGRTRMFRHQWHGMVRASERGAEKVHPTQKPVAMAVWAFEELGFGDVVADLFGGSGSTLLACAQTGRVARVIELDPRYCDVIRRRWTRYAKEAGIDAGEGALDG